MSKMGRPLKADKPLDSRITVRLDAETKAKLDKYCSGENLSIGDAVRNAIEEYTNGGDERMKKREVFVFNVYKLPEMEKLYQINTKVCGFEETETEYIVTDNNSFEETVYSKDEYLFEVNEYYVDEYCPE